LKNSISARQNAHVQWVQTALPSSNTAALIDGLQHPSAGPGPKWYSEDEIKWGASTWLQFGMVNKVQWTKLTKSVGGAEFNGKTQQKKGWEGRCATKVKRNNVLNLDIRLRHLDQNQHILFVPKDLVLAKIGFAT
jgi:hypothetical protein